MDMMKMMKQVRELKKKQKALASKTVEFTASGVTVKMTGDMKPKSISIPPELIDTGNVKKIETAVLDAFKGVLNLAQAAAADEMKSLTAGMNLPF
ncbi:MAG: YbaB/EbfC family nucleoid-associated protein [Kiritimatiellales bacterium]